MVAIVTDDNARFTPEEAKRLGIYVVPMPIIIDGKERFEGRDLTAEEFYRLQTSGSEIHTSQPSPGNLMAVWREALKSAETLVHIPMSSGLTQSVATAKLLSHEEEFEGRVFVADNHRISVTLRLAVYDALKMAHEGKSAAEIRDYLEATGHDSRIYIYVDTLEYLKKGGRVTPAAAAMGAAFHVKPILKIEGGKLDAKAKAIGSKRAQQMLVDFILDDLKNIFNQPSKDHCFALAYTGDAACLSQAKEFRNRFAEAVGVSPEEILLDPLSLSVATHIGPGALATTVTDVISKADVIEAANREFNLDK